MATYEGKWRCENCQTVNRGRDLNCATCGDKRDDDVEFFLDENPEPLADEDLIRRAKAGVDWMCRYCGGSNEAANVECSSCGNRRSAEDKTGVEETRGINDWTEKKLREGRTTKKAERFLPVEEPIHDEPTENLLARFAFLKRIPLGIGIALVIVLVGGFFYLWMKTYPVDVEVVNLEWTRAIALEEFRTISESSWESDAPYDARIQTRLKSLHHTDKVPTGSRTVPETYTERVSDGTERYVCGRTNKKNGFFEDKYCTRTKYKTVTKTRNRKETIYTDVPVYRNRVTYLVDRWTSAGERRTSGSDFNPQWAPVSVDGVRSREAGRSESYNLVCKELGGNNKLYKISVGAERWQNFARGQKLHGRVNWFGKLLKIEEMPEGGW